MIFLPFDRRINDRIPVVIFCLVGINLAITIHTFFGFDEVRITAIFAKWGAIPTHLETRSWATHMFLHAGPAHVIGNMLFLTLFGMNVERKIGPFAMVVFYFLSGFAALALFLVFNPNFDAPLVGASGAVSGVVGMHLFLFRKRTVDVMWYALVATGMVRLPAMVVAGFWFGLELLQAILLNERVMVAHWAHVGGFIGGIGLTPLLMLIYKGHPEVYGAETKKRTRDAFEEKGYIPDAPAPARPAGMRLVAREWRPVTLGVRRIVDGVAPGSGAFARPSRMAAGLAQPQAEDLRARLERAGFPATVLQQVDEIPETPFVFIDRVELSPEGIALIEARGTRHLLDPRLVANVQTGTTRGSTPIVDVVTRDPWRRYRISGATASTPIEKAVESLRTAFPTLEVARTNFESLSDLDEYFRWRLQFLAT